MKDVEGEIVRKGRGCEVGMGKRGKRCKKIGSGKDGVPGV